MDNNIWDLNLHNTTQTQHYLPPSLDIILWILKKANQPLVGFLDFSYVLFSIKYHLVMKLSILYRIPFVAISVYKALHCRSFKQWRKNNGLAFKTTNLTRRSGDSLMFSNCLLQVCFRISIKFMQIIRWHCLFQECIDEWSNYCQNRPPFYMLIDS